MRNPPPDARELPPLTPLQRVRRDLTSWPRRATARHRVLPNLLVLGAQRAGTTSLYEHLGLHPGVWMSRTKEVHYFDNYADQPLDWYRSHFPTRRWVEARSRDLGYGIAVGEGSPYYLFHPAVPGRVRAALPRARLVVLLRDPVERALSHFRHERKWGFEPEESFERAWALEAERLARVGDLSAPGAFDEHHNHHSYAARGDYAPQLAAWLEHYPASQLLVIRSEDLFSRPSEVMGRLFRFLDLPQVNLGGFPALNRTRRTPQTESERAVRARLVEHFRPRVSALEQLLGRSMGWAEAWDEGEPGSSGSGGGPA
jgi:hypothetical protein